MKKIYLLLILFFSAKVIFSQAAIDIQLHFSDGSGESRDRNLGLDLAASAGIDTVFDEEALPPWPFGLEVRFDLNPFGQPYQVYKDYRNANSTVFTDTVEHRLLWQYAVGAAGLTITYDFPQGISMQLTDNITGTIFNSGILSDSGSYLVPNGTAFTAAKLFMMYNGVIVPVELTSFNASVDANTILLRWTTATEVNNKGFGIERKTENSSWKQIGFRPGNGTTTNPARYSFTDDNFAGSDRYYYRLKQIDYDGSFAYSNIISIDVNTPAAFNLQQNFPNPFNPTTTIAFTIPKSSNVKVNIYNQIGEKVTELVNKNLEAGTYNCTWNASKYSSGIYFYELIAEDFKSIKKMSLIK